MELKFKRDTSFRKRFFTPESFAHPAKMDAQLLLWIVERYTKLGEVILDPMAGMGTTMLACTLGRSVVLVELEQKFCKMCKSNWEKVSAMPQLGYEMGHCNIIQGDARQIEGLLVDKCIFSPPYAESKEIHDIEFLERTAGDVTLRVKKGITKGHYKTKDARDRELARKKRGLIENPDNIGNLLYGQIDKIVTSPPHGDSLSAKRKGYTELKNLADTRQYPENPNNLGNLHYGNIDSIITSPPYEGSASRENRDELWERLAQDSSSARFGRSSHPKTGEAYSSAQDNIGNLKSDSYLQAMLQVYQQCHKVLRPKGLMILVTKNFIRNKQVIRLDEDTIKLCEQAGFSFLERHYRKLTSVSFWRRIYHQKYPGVEKIEFEDLLVFQRSKGER